MYRVGVADLGSNTARLIVFTCEPGRWFRITDGIREQVRLGEGLARDNRLTKGAMARAAAALELFVDYGRATGLERLEILATSAVRDAENGDEFLARIAPLGGEISVLTGEEEAALGVLATANGFSFDDAWVMDLGGGSAQLSLMRDRRYVRGRAYPLGAVRLTETFLRSDPPKASEVRALEARVEKELAGLAGELDGELPLVAIGGTIRNLARRAQKRREYPLSMLHGYRLTAEDLEEVTEELLDVKTRRRMKLRGLNPERADIIVAGALVYRWLLRRTGLERLTISGHGVREGAFFRHFLEPPHLLADVRRFSVENRAQQYPQPPAHLRQVRRLAGRLFDGLEPLHHLGPAERALLDAAAKLHDSGATLDYFRHDKHGAYLMTSAPLDGYSHRELALVTLLVRYHRRGNPRLSAFAELMRSGDRRRLLRLATCLRLAESVERSRAGRVRDLEVEIRNKKVRVTLLADEEPTIELWEAQKHAALFQKAFGRSLSLRAAVARDTARAP